MTSNMHLRSEFLTFYSDICKLILMTLSDLERREAGANFPVELRPYVCLT